MAPSAPLVFEGGLSASLRRLIEHERADIEQVTHRAVQMILASVPDYALSSDPQMVQDLGRASWINAELWFDALVDAKPVTPETLEPIVVFARRRVHQGVSLTGLLRAYRIIGRAFWMRLMEAAGQDPALHAELLFKISPYLLQHFDVVAEAIAASYLQEQSQHARWRDRLRQELWSIVCSRPDDAPGFRQHAEALGLPFAQPHGALVMRLGEAARVQPERHIDRPLHIVARRSGQAADALMRAIHRDHLIVWMPMPAAQTAVAFERAMAELAAVVGAAAEGVEAIGIGLPGVGAHGWQASMEQGLRALSAPPDARLAAPVHRYAQILIEDAIAQRANAAEFMQSTVEMLASDATLADTLDAYFEHRQHRKETAAALAVHPNTLDHRLGRIEVLLEGSFADIDWLARLNAAVRLRRQRCAS